MKTFDFYKEEKVNYWERTSFTVKSESYHDAATVAGRLVEDNLEESDTVSIGECTISFESCQPVPVEHNQGAATVKIYDGNDRLVASNHRSGDVWRQSDEMK